MEKFKSVLPNIDPILLPHMKKVFSVGRLITLLINVLKCTPSGHIIGQ
jgi:hypothetical protein